jgi:hypothetical protein
MALIAFSRLQREMDRPSTIIESVCVVCYSKAVEISEKTKPRVNLKVLF